MAWLVALVLAILTKRAAAAPSVRPVTPTAQAPARYRQAGVRPDFGTIPATWASDLPARHPPWQASPAALLGVARGERVPIVPAYEGPSMARLSENTATQSGNVNAGDTRRVSTALALGKRFIPTDRDDDWWNTWQWKILKACGDYCDQTRRSLIASRVPESSPIVAELEYARDAYRADAALLEKMEQSTRSGRPGHVASDDPLLAEAFARTAYVAEWLKDYAEEVIITAALLYATGAASATAAAAVVGAGAAGAVGGVAAAAGPIGLVGVLVVILAVAVYAYVTGARPGTTRGLGDKVIKFPRSGSAEEPVFMRASDVDAYMHMIYRASTLALQRAGAFEGGLVS